MAFNFAFKRIPLYFVIDAPESTVGKILGTVQGIGSQVLLGTIQQAAKIMPALGLDNPYSDVDLGLGGGTGTNKNKKFNKIVIPMLVNPTSMSIQKQPTVNKTLTKRGILNQYWQAQPDAISFSGRAASDRSVFIFTQLDQLVSTTETGTRNLVTMIYKFGGVYRGYIENFRTAIDAEKPGVFDYSFDFQFADKRHFKIFYFAVKTNTLNEAIQEPAKFANDQLKLAASELKAMSGVSIKI